MSLHPQDIPPVPATTATTARAAFPRGNRYMAMRDELGTLYTDEDFAALFPTCGQPAKTPWRLALVLVFQFAEGWSDAQAAEAVRGRIDWKYALSLAVTAAGFDASVLSEFRDRLIAGNRALHLLDAMLARFRAVGLLQARGRPRTDSTQVLAAVRALKRLHTVGETMRHALTVLAVAAPAWLTPHLHPDWAERYGHRFEDYRLPTAKPERQAWAEQLGIAGRALFQALYAPDAPRWLRELPAVQTLRSVWVQQYYAVPMDAPLRWRDVADLPPAAHLINTPDAVEARYSTKRSTQGTGYKVHLTEPCDDDTPHFITHVLTTGAPVPACHATELIHTAVAAKARLPAEHLLDAGYTDADNLVTSHQQHIDLIGPVATNQHWQMLRRGRVRQRVLYTGLGRAGGPGSPWAAESEMVGDPRYAGEPDHQYPIRPDGVGRLASPPPMYAIGGRTARDYGAAARPARGGAGCPSATTDAGVRGGIRCPRRS